MKRLLLLGLVIPSVVFGVSIDLQALGQRSGGSPSLSVDGYSLLHPWTSPVNSFAGAGPASPGFKGWWITVARDSGAAFDGFSFSGQLTGLESDHKTSAILVQGQTMDGNYYAEIFQFNPRRSEPGTVLTLELDEHFKNLSWLRFSGLHGAPGFSLDNVELSSNENVPENGPGTLFIALALAGLACVHAGMQMKAARPVPQRIKQPRYSQASSAPR
jgi:hypothetical protein